MKNILKLTISLSVILLFFSCETSMTPVEVSNTLPNLTKSKYLTQFQAADSVTANSCKYLTKGRKYTAPIGFTSRADLENGAQGIDEWVALDGGNAYVLTNFSWVTIDEKGTTQLNIEFDTLHCK